MADTYTLAIDINSYKRNKSNIEIKMINFIKRNIYKIMNIATGKSSVIIHHWLEKWLGAEFGQFKKNNIQP